MQVLWCPLDHPEEGYNPRVRLYWRRSADVSRPLAAAPEPPVVNDSYLPTPCIVYPEQIREYQYGGLLPEELDARITALEETEEESDNEEGINYQSDLSLAPGWKVGGFANWSLTDPHPMDCTECGIAMTLLFTADSGEWHGSGDSWRPVEDPAEATPNPTDVSIGRGYALYIFRCPVSFDHPPATAMQCSSNVGIRNGALLSADVEAGGNRAAADVYVRLGGLSHAIGAPLRAASARRWADGVLSAACELSIQR
ncbi:hypothetical protein ACIODS_29665 [Micromonospora chalcea]|uniref:hypothetical protein n=1 Tax=Micromonospora chalcea TaxID=1874 RepID=UPI0037F76E6F